MTLEPLEDPQAAGLEELWVGQLDGHAMITDCGLMVPEAWVLIPFYRPGN